MESKRKNVYIVLFVITTIIAGCLAAYFKIMANKEKDELNAKVLELENKLNTENVSNDVNQTQNTYNILDVSKKLNDKYYLCKQMGNVKAKIVDNKAYVAVIEGNLGTNTYTKKLNEYYEIQGVSGKVVDICIEEIPTSKYPIFVLLMEDGTLEATKFVDGDDIVSKGKLDGYENIVRIDNCESVDENKFGDDIVKTYSSSVCATDINGNSKIVGNLY